MPSVMISPKSEIMFSVMPAAYMMAMAANMAAGMPAATQKAVRTFRNRNSRQITSPSPVSPLSTRMSSRSVIASARVRISSTVTPCGRLACIRAATSSTRAWMSMASPWSERSMRTDMARSSPTK